MAGRFLTSILYLIGLTLFYIGAGRLVRYLGRKNPKILLYHDCSPRETTYTAGLDCTTPPSSFASHLDYLRRYHKVVSVDDIAAGTAPLSSVAITFDDGYRSVYENAFPLLIEKRLPATIYLVSDVIGNQALVWVNELNHALRTSPKVTFKIVRDFFPKAPVEGATHVIDHCRLNYDVESMRALLTSLRNALRYTEARHALEAQLYVSWDEIEEMSKLGITFGNHTRTHPNLERLSREQQFEEIDGAQKILSERISLVRSFAYPFGHHSVESAPLAAGVGLKSVAEVGGYNRPVVPLGLGRAHLSGQSVPGLFAQMEIVEPVKGAIRAILRKHATIHV